MQEKKCNELLELHPHILNRLAVQNISWSNKTRKSIMYSTVTNLVTVSSALLVENKKNSFGSYSIPLIGKVCRQFFLTFFRCSDYPLRKMLSFLADSSSLTLKPHGNISNSNARLDEKIIDGMRSFLQEFSLNHGESNATRKYIRKKENGEATVTVESEEVILLPSHWSFVKIYKLFLLKSKLTENDISVLSFVRFWKSECEFKNLKIRSPSKDVCDECTIFKNSIINSSCLKLQEEILEDINEIQSNHISNYRFMRKLYEDDIRWCRDVNESSRPIVLAFDYAQNIELPHKANQPGSFYFYSLKKCYQFGVVDEELDKHTHMIYYESASGKGCDEVCSMVQHYIFNFQARPSRHLILWADNCGGQNKNSTMIQMLMDLVRKDHFDTVELKFQIKGHTRNSVDRGFGFTKRLYNNSDAYTIGCVANIIQNSATDSKTSKNKCFPVIIEGPDVFRKYTDYYKQFYKKTEKVQSYQIFKCTKQDLTSVYCFSPAHPNLWVPHKVTVERRCITNNPLMVLSKIGFPVERIVDFYKNVRQYVPAEFQEELCPKPSVEEIEYVRLIKSKRASEGKIKKEIKKSST